MKFLNTFAMLAVLATSKAQEEEPASVCGPADGSISIAGSSTVLPVAEAWAEAYMEMCPNVTVTVESGGSSVGAGRVCNNPDRGEAVDIGNMSRDWKTSEASRDGYSLQCLVGDTDRKAIQLDVSGDRWLWIISLSIGFPFSSA